jgi:hypothetical protein
MQQARKKEVMVGLAFLFLLFIPTSASIAQAFPGTPVYESPIASALDLVVEELRKRKLPVDDFQLKVIAEPIVRPKHAHLHRPPPVEPFGTGKIKGSIVDPTGAPMPEARLVLLANGETRGRVVRPNSQGEFELDELSPGLYELHAGFPGFKTAVQKLNVKPNQVRPITIALEVGRSSDVLVLGDSLDSATGAEKLDLSQVIVEVGVYQEQEVYRVFHVWLGKEGAHLIDLLPNYQEDLLPPLPLREQERLQVADELSFFYEASIDVMRGPERFYPFLPDDMHKYRARKYSPGTDPAFWQMIPAVIAKQLSDDEIRLSVALLLDFLVQRMWLGFEELRVPRLDEIPDTSGLKTAQDFRKWLRELESFVAEIKENLRESGMATPDHLATCSTYMRRLLGDGLVVKESNATHRVEGLPDTGELYLVRVGPETYLHFTRVNQGLRLILLTID